MNQSDWNEKARERGRQITDLVNSYGVKWPKSGACTDCREKIVTVIAAAIDDAYKAGTLDAANIVYGAVSAIRYTVEGEK